ncbi:MAG: hypothetical protein L0K82_04000, partial [Pisciglobus halotolerans]|nr:hypothetical protein [Pisciglobus halotolerans]
MYEVKMYRDSSDYDGTRIHYDNASKIKLISGNIAKGINVIDSFTFTMNMNNPAYNSIETFKTLITVKNRKTGALEFDGYVQRQNGNMSDNG